jgi:CheY-like chemotaxis protein
MAPPLTGIRITIAEDHDDTRDILEQVLCHQGAILTSVSTARDAPAIVGHCDIILTDFSMPGEDGVWLLEQVTLQGRPVPVLAVSGFAEQQVPRLADVPFTRKLLKPVDPWHLAGIIIKVLQPPAPRNETPTPDT